MSHKLLLACFLIASISACTHTVYVVHLPDGTAVEVADAEQAALLHEHFAAQQQEKLEAEPDKDRQDEEPEKKEEIRIEKEERVVVKDPDPVDLEDAIELGMMPVNDFVLVGQNEPVFLQVELGAKNITTASRAPISVAIVIDRSGSMSGEKMTRVKDAALWLIDHMQTGDHIAIVSYSSDVRVDASEVLDDKSRFVLRNAVRRLQSGGGTFLSGGLETGATEIRKVLDSEHINRVVLLSDGNANEGVTDSNTLSRMSDVLREEGISVTTMGVGLDYNEDVMEAVAMYGGGNYYFIAEAEQLDDIFAAELESLGTIVARDAVLELELPEDVEIQEIYGYQYEREGDTLRVQMNAVSSGEKRRVLMALNVDKAKMKRKKGEDLVVAKGRLSFRNELNQKDEQVDLSPVKVSLTDDSKLHASSYNGPVLEKVETVRNAEAQKEAIAYIEAGDRASAEKVIDSRKAQAIEINSSLGSTILDTQIQDLDTLAGEVQALPSEADELKAHTRSSSSYKASKKKRKASAAGAIAY